MTQLHRIFTAGQTIISLLFVVCAAALIIFACLELWHGINPTVATPIAARLNAVLESVSLLTVSVASLELGQTILEELVQRQAQVSSPTRARRFLSRFMIVLVVALSIEGLASVFLFLHEDPSYLPYASFIALSAAALLTAWGVFVRLNRSVEELEPEAMERAKREDAKIERG